MKIVNRLLMRARQTGRFLSQCWEAVLVRIEGKEWLVMDERDLFL